MSWKNKKLDYRSGLYKTRLTLFADYSQPPEIDGVPVNYIPRKAYDSPFIQGDFGGGLMPGTASHGAKPAQGARPAVADNGDGGSIIANNIISEFGYGDSHWIWGNDNAPLKFDKGPLKDTPPLSEVIIQGNMIYDTGRDQILVDGKPKTEPPRYKHAVRVPADAEGLHFSNNLFHPGTAGVSNVELKP